MGGIFDLEFARHYCIPNSKHIGQDAVNDGLYSILFLDGIPFQHHQNAK